MLFLCALIILRLLKRLRAATASFFYGNGFMALCGVVWTASTPYQLPIKSFVPQPALWVFVFGGILAVYNAARAPIVHYYHSQTIRFYEQWMNQHRKALIITTVMGIILSLASLWWLPPLSLWPAAIAGLLVLLYYIPSNYGLIPGLRHFGLMKNGVIGLVWALITVLLPLTVAQQPFLNKEVLLLLVERLLFIFTIMLPFDLTDVDADQKVGVKTLPYFWGEAFTKKMIGGLLLVLAALMLLAYGGSLFFIQLGILAYLAVLLSQLHQKRSSLHFLIFWDGAIFLQGGLILLYSLL